MSGLDQAEPFSLVREGPRSNAGTRRFRQRRGPRPGQQHARIGERTNEAWADETVGFYYVVVDAMLKTGFKPDEIGKIGGGNFLRVFGEAVQT
jgi:hypothetical protein